MVSNEKTNVNKDLGVNFWRVSRTETPVYKLFEDDWNITSAKISSSNRYYSEGIQRLTVAIFFDCDNSRREAFL